MKRITVFTGNFGSGKTELAINTALGLREEGKRVRLVDVDIINPYFKSSFRRAMLEDAGVYVIGPNSEGALPPEIISVFDDRETYGVFDVGGDPVGATVLGRYKERFDEAADSLEVLYVVNACRPLSDTPERVLKMMDDIERKSRLKINALINNTNLAAMTTADELIAGQEMLAEIAQKRGLCIKWITGRPEVLSAFREKAGAYEGELRPIHIYMREEWMDMV
ncbi:MAG: ATP-binding protein [Bacillota bacterium]